ncbi:alpha/beta fold hydrolase [Tannockella kyphosi]|uniref:alpha/beta fold hydrolase n=1 Tax=Tannockella kyphosi TaxID=2899121 RepID=UPI0020119ADA|nr:alpha/beta fold hydrolase [Tannockella kyphosi]
MKKHFKKIILALFVVCVGLGMYSYHYLTEYYVADSSVYEVYENVEYEVIDNLTILYAEDGGDTGIIFYPGAKVEAIAYLPILEKLVNKGYTCVLVDMPFHMAIFDVDAADDVFELDLDIDSWYIAGHSMGGSIASSYAADHQDLIDGAIMLGAYVYGDYPIENTITIYGSLNDNLEDKIDYTENIYIIEGGNHAQFGNYGFQDGDKEATISSDKQQNIAVDYIDDFITNR